ncbi:MAG: hypothetical protein AAGJ10_09725 [Bacteroidota bacterium]
MAFRCLLSVAILVLLAASTAKAQTTQFSDYVEAATYAADEGRTLLVYFYSTERGHPTQLRDWLTDEAATDESYKRFAVAGFDVDTASGRALAEALYGRERLAAYDKSQAALVVDHGWRRRGVAFLGASQPPLDATTWHTFVSNAMRSPNSPPAE